MSIELVTVLSLNTLAIIVEILMMISEPKELQSEDWELKLYPSDAQRILQKNRGFLSIKNKKN